MLKVQEWKGKRTQVIFKKKQKPTQKCIIKSLLAQGFGLRKNSMPKPDLLPFLSGHLICRHLCLAVLVLCPCLAKAWAAFGDSGMGQKEVLRLNPYSFYVFSPHFHLWLAVLQLLGAFSALKVLASWHKCLLLCYWCRCLAHGTRVHGMADGGHQLH